MKYLFRDVHCLCWEKVKVVLHLPTAVSQRKKNYFKVLISTTTLHYTLVSTACHLFSHCLTSAHGTLASRAAPVPGFGPPGPPVRWACSSCIDRSSTAHTGPCRGSPVSGTALNHRAWTLGSRRTPAINTQIHRIRRETWELSNSEFSQKHKHRHLIWHQIFFITSHRAVQEHHRDI